MSYQYPKALPCKDGFGGAVLAAYGGDESHGFLSEDGFNAQRKRLGAA